MHSLHKCKQVLSKKFVFFFLQFLHFIGRLLLICFNKYSFSKRFLHCRASPENIEANSLSVNIVSQIGHANVILSGSFFEGTGRRLL